jgi:hypothetical protein
MLSEIAFAVMGTTVAQGEPFYTASMTSSFRKATATPSAPGSSSRPSDPFTY